MVDDVKNTKEVVKDVNVFMKSITEIQSIHQLITNENVRDLKSINLYGQMPINDMIHCNSQLDPGLAGNYMDPLQLGRYMNMIKVACLNFK